MLKKCSRKNIKVFIFHRQIVCLYRSRKLCMHSKNTTIHDTQLLSICAAVFPAAFSDTVWCDGRGRAECICWRAEPRLQRSCVRQYRSALPETPPIHCAFDFKLSLSHCTFRIFLLQNFHDFIFSYATRMGWQPAA